MFFKTLSYIKFLLKSTNKHGVHSPFVFDFVTKGLYKKKGENSTIIKNLELQKLSKKEYIVLSKILTYFTIDELFFDVTSLQESKNEKYKIVYLNSIENINTTDLSTFKSKDIIVIHRIHQQKKSALKWQEIIKNDHAKVTIDLFYFGLIFFRKKQAKEHFKIRV
jgi:hypothetical protein